VSKDVLIIPSSGDVRFYEFAASGTNYVGFRAPDSIPSDSIWVLPSSDGVSNQILATNGAGTLFWKTDATGGSSSSGINPQLDNATAAIHYPVFVSTSGTDITPEISTKLKFIPSSGSSDYPFFEVSNQFRVGDFDNNGYAQIQLWDSPNSSYEKIFTYSDNELNIWPNSSTNFQTPLFSLSSAVFQPFDSSTIPIIIQGKASQSADLQQWKDASANVITRVTAAGSISGVGSGIFMQRLATGTSNPTAQLQVNHSSVSGVAIFGSVDRNLYIQNDGTSTGILLQHQGQNRFEVISTGTVSINKSSANALKSLVFYDPNSNLYEYNGFGSTSGATNALRYNVVNNNFDHIFFRGDGGASSTELMRIRGNRTVGINTAAPAAMLHVTPTGTTATGIIVRGVASQTADLQQWQNSAGTALARIGSDGYISGVRFVLESAKYIGTSFGAGEWFTSYVSDTSHQFTIGGSSPLVINSTTSNASSGIIIRGASNQTALVVRGAGSNIDVQKWETVGGNTLARISFDGSISGVASGIFDQNLRVSNIPNGTTETDVVLVKSDGTFVKRPSSAIGGGGSGISNEQSIINALIFG